MTKLTFHIDINKVTLQKSFVFKLLTLKVAIKHTKWHSNMGDSLRIKELAVFEYFLIFSFFEKERKLSLDHLWDIFLCFISNVVKRKQVVLREFF